MTAPIPHPKPAEEPMIEFPRWWIEHVRDGLQGPLPSGKLGDWAFTFREQLTDALESKPSHASLKARNEELVAALRGILESDALTTFEGCECASCAPIMRGRAILQSKGAA